MPEAATLPLKTRELAAPGLARALTAPEFSRLASRKIRRAYQGYLRAFMAFTGIHQPEEFRSVTCDHILQCLASSSILTSTEPQSSLQIWSKRPFFQCKKITKPCPSLGIVIPLQVQPKLGKK